MSLLKCKDLTLDLGLCKFRRDKDNVPVVKIRECILYYFARDRPYCTICLKPDHAYTSKTFMH